MRYRAKAHACNVCPLKERCTDSDRGREIVRPLDPWPHSEAGRFHRVIALLMVTLGALVVLAAGVRNHEPEEAASWPRVLVAALRRPVARARPPLAPGRLPRPVAVAQPAHDPHGRRRRADRTAMGLAGANGGAGLNPSPDTDTTSQSRRRRGEPTNDASRARQRYQTPSALS